MDIENLNLLIGFLVSLILSSLLSLIPVWQLIFIAGIMGGIINRKIFYGGLSGGLGVGVYWTLYVIDGIFFKGLYNLFDIFGSFLISSGFGWLILIIIVMLGTLFGFLGGILGSSGRGLVEYGYQTIRANRRSE